MALCVLAASALAQDESLEGRSIREISYQGLGLTKDFVVAREIHSKEGEAYSKELADADRERLLNLDIFSQVSALATAENDSVDLRFEFVENFPILPSPKLSITDENGLSVGAGVSTPNLFGKDISASFQFLVGGATTLGLTIENPWFAGNHLGYRLEYAHRERFNAIADFNETTNEVYFWLRTYLGKYSRLGGTVQFLNVQSDRSGATLSPDNADNVSRLGVNFGWDSRDAFTNTQSGWWNEINISQEIEIFENSTQFTQLDLDIRRYQPLPFWDRHNLGLFSLTTLRTGQIGTNIAPWQALGMGGTNTVRGWEYAARTGKNQFINFIEYRITPMLPRRVSLPFNIQYRAGLQLAAFADVGITWNESREFALNNTLAGGGLGVRLILPGVSLVRFDVGWGQAGAKARLHIGTLEKAEMARKRVR